MKNCGNAIIKISTEISFIPNKYQYACFTLQMLNAKQEEAVRLAKDGHNLFISGGIGTGKTHTIETIVHELKHQAVHIAVTASTGLASQQIKGNNTCIYGIVFRYEPLGGC